MPIDGSSQVVVHRIDSSCSNGDTCPQFTSIDTDPAGGYVVGSLVTDEVALELHRTKIGPGEALIRVDRTLAPEVWPS